MNRTTTTSLARMDWSLLLAVVLIGLVGVYNLQSTSMSTGSNIHIKQFYWLAFGTVMMVVAASIDYRHLDRYSPFLYALAVLLLALVLGIGKEVNGSRSSPRSRAGSIVCRAPTATRFGTSCPWRSCSRCRCS